MNPKLAAYSFMRLDLLRIFGELIIELTCPVTVVESAD